MRFQTSLEFIFILAAISILLLSTIVIYSNKIDYGRDLLSNFTPTLNLSVSLSPSFSLSAYIPPQTSVGSIYQMSYVYLCSNGSAHIYAKSNSIRFIENNITIKAQNVAAGYLYFIPEEEGIEQATLFYNATCGSSVHLGYINLTTYSMTQNQTIILSPGSFEITKRNESIVYPYANKNNIDSLSFRGHCELYPPYIQNTSVIVECGTNNAWYYGTLNYYCYDTDQGLWYATCIYPTETQYNLTNINIQNYSFLYQLTGAIGYKGSYINFTFNNTRCTSLFLGKTDIGQACIVNVTGAGPLAFATVISNATRLGLANQTLYQSYIQAKNSMYNILSYYNATNIGDAQQAQIQTAINYYLKAASTLEEKGFINMSNSCKLYKNYMSCRPLYPLAYVINATITSKRIWIGNTTLYYQGSTLNIRD